VAVVAVAAALAFGRPQRDHHTATDREPATSAIGADVPTAARAPARGVDPTAAASPAATPTPDTTQPPATQPAMPQAAATQASAPPVADAGAAPVRPPWANRPWRSLGRTPNGTPPPKPAGTDGDPFHGVTGTGL